MKLTSSLIVLAVALTLSTGALAEPPGPPPAPHAPRVASTHHTGHFNGQTVAYTATVEEHVYKDASGAPLGTIITTAYIRDGVSDPSKRPVMFLFNGGPGASSSPLHMTALGPVRRVGETPGDRNSGHLGENVYSPLDAVDLVFIDPMGTGFSRAFAGAGTKALYSRTGDATSVKWVIGEWLKANHREASPRYLTGESYGTTRAAMILKDDKDLPFDGVLLVALAGDAPGHEMPYVVSLPTMATAAWHYQKIDRKGRSVEQVFDEAVQFARTDYVSALIQGSSLPDADRKRIAGRMSQLIGLPAALIEQNDLRVSKNVFMFNLLKDQGLRTGMLDVRVTAPMTPDAEGGIDDPALGVVPTRAPGAAKGPPPSPASIGAVPSPQTQAYFTQDLKFPSTDTYYGVNFTVNAAWDHEGMSDVFPALGAAMKANPKMRLFWAAGYYDLTTPAYEGRYTLDQDGVPGERLTAAYFAGPHGVYAGEDNLARFTAAVRKFVTPGS
jgi:carboxypeptidase C (cathepsin A)